MQKLAPSLVQSLALHVRRVEAQGLEGPPQQLPMVKRVPGSDAKSKEQMSVWRAKFIIIYNKTIKEKCHLELMLK